MFKDKKPAATAPVEKQERKAPPAVMKSAERFERADEREEAGELPGDAEAAPLAPTPGQTSQQRAADLCVFCEGQKGGAQKDLNVIGGMYVCDQCMKLMGELHHAGTGPFDKRGLFFGDDDYAKKAPRR